MKIDLSFFAEAIEGRRCGACLLYGNDEELQLGILDELNDFREGKEKPEAIAVRYLEEEVFFETWHEILSPGLFESSGHQIIVISGVSDRHFKPFKEILSRTDFSFRTLVITSLGLRTQSSWVREFTQNGNLGAVGCYECSLGQSTRIFQRRAKRRGLVLSPQMLSACGQASRKGTWGDVVTKLVLYGSDLSPQQFEELIVGDTDLEFLSLFHDPFQVLSHLFELLSDTSEGIKCVRSWQQHTNQLLQFRLHLDEGLSIAEAEKKISPPLFFKIAEKVRALIPFLKQRDLTQALAHLFQAEIAIKEASSPTRSLFHLREALSRIYPVQLRSSAMV